MQNVSSFILPKLRKQYFNFLAPCEIFNLVFTGRGEKFASLKRQFGTSPLKKNLINKIIIIIMWTYTTRLFLVLII